ncbi:NAD(P)H-binding protein [Streptomyces olivoreticuli]|uniref:NAD(P)H-binding protein n=1 Tax=Streptomyces olivoreticuli TaxID=68246 RepID=UPI000E23DDC5|nr:NAD(P)H-binding protein [Streptomyces olivoreticuli]
MTEILVLGATGKTGSRVLPRLRALGHRVRAASRSGATRFDWADRSTWDTALAGAEVVYLVPTETLSLDERAAFVTRAKAAGVRRLVQLSVRGIDQDGTHPTEAAVRGSGLEWTVLRPCWFAQDFAAPDFFLPGVVEGEVRTPAREGREPFIDADDIADVAVAALTEDGHHGQTYDLSGPRALSITEALALISTATGRSIAHRHQTPTDYAAEQTAAGHPAADAEAIGAFLDQVSRGEDDYLSDGVERVLGRAPRPFEDYVKMTAEQGIWNT